MDKCLPLIIFFGKEEKKEWGGVHCLESKRMKEWDRFSFNSTRAFSVWTFINSADMQEKKRPLYKWGVGWGWGGWYRRGRHEPRKGRGKSDSAAICVTYVLCNIQHVLWSACLQPCFLYEEDGI